MATASEDHATAKLIQPAKQSMLAKSTTLHKLPSNVKRRRRRQLLYKSKEKYFPKFPPKRFWDNLSEVPLSPSALRALDELNAEARAPVQPQTRRHLRQRPRSIIGVCHQPTGQVGDAHSSTSSGDIRAFARHGGPDLTNLRGYSAPSATENDISYRQSVFTQRKRGSQSSAMASTASKTTSTKSFGPYARTFRQHLVDYNILHDGYQYPGARSPPEPDNMDEIRHALAQRRASLSQSNFSDKDFRNFRLADARARSERDVTTYVIPVIAGDDSDKTCIAREIAFTNLRYITDGSLVPGNPDLYYGARPELLYRAIRQELSDYIEPSTQDDLPIVPNYLLQVKGPDGKLSVARLQACYDGALGARGLHHLQSYKRSQSEPEYDNNAYTITSIYHGGQLLMYTIHPVPPSVDGGQPGFVMTHIGSWSVAGDYDTFRRGVAAFRNGRDWAERQRDRAINEANERASRDPVT